MANSVDLPWLSLYVEEARTHLVALLAADHVHRVPEVRCAHLVCDILELAQDLAALDLVKELAAELRVVALLVDGETAVAHDGDPAVRRGNDLVPTDVLLA